MYNYHKRMIPKREDYRTEFPGNYYTSSSVYSSYSPTTSTSDCPQHGRSRKRTTLCLVTSVILATIGVLCIAGIAAYLGIISKNISNNMGQFEESYLQSNTSSSRGDTSEEDSLLYNQGRSQEESGFIDLTNSLSDTNTGLIGPPGDDDLINHQTREPEVVADNAITRKNLAIPKTPEIVHGVKMEATSSNSNTKPSPIHISAKPVTVVVKSTSTVSSSNSDAIASNNNYNNHYNPVDMIPPPTKGMDNSVTYFTEEATTARPTSKTPPRNRHNRYPLTNSHSLATSTTTQPASTSVEDQSRHKTRTKVKVVVGKDVDDEFVTSTQSSYLGDEEHENKMKISGSSTHRESVVHVAPSDAKTKVSNAGSQKNDDDNSSSNQKAFSKKHGLVNEEESSGNHKDDNHRNHNHQYKLDSGEGVSSVTSASSSHVKHQSQPEIRNNNDEQSKYFVPITPIISSERQEDVNSDLLNNHQMPISFDRISSEFGYDKNPWIPLLDRPNLDKRPRLDIINKPSVPQSTTTTQPIIVWNTEYSADEDIRENSSPQPPPQNYYGYGHTAPGSSSGNENQHAKPTSGFVDNGSISHTLNTSTSTSTYEKIHEQTQDSVVKENNNATKGAVHPDSSYVEETTGGFRPVSIPAYTVIIPHIPNSPPKNLQANSTKRNGPIDSDEVLQEYEQHDGLVEEDRNLNTSFKFDRIGLVETSDDSAAVSADKKLLDAESDNKQQSNNKNKIHNDHVESLAKNEAEDIKEEDYEDEDNPSPTKIYTLDSDSIDIVPDTLGSVKDSTHLLEIQDLKKPFPDDTVGTHSTTYEDTTPKEPDPIIKSTTDLIMSTLGSLNLIKPTTINQAVETELDLESKLRASDLTKGSSEEEDEEQKVGGDGTESPLFPPVRSYVAVNQPLRPKPSPASWLESTLKKQLRMSEDQRDIPELRPDLSTTSSLQKVLSMMMTFDGDDESRKFSADAPIVNVTKQNVNLLLVQPNDTATTIKIIKTGQLEPAVTSFPETELSSTVTTTHREQKSYNRHSKLDEQFTPPTHIHVPVPLIVTESPEVSIRPNKTKLTNVTVNQNSPVYKFVLKQGQSIEHLLKEILFENYTDAHEEAVTLSPTPQFYRPRPLTSHHHASVQGPSLKSLDDSSNKNGIAFANVKINPNFETSIPPSTKLMQTTPKTFFPSTTDPPVIQTATSIVINDSEDVWSDCPTNTSFRCVSSGKCIPSYLRCNFIKECPDNSDEANCSCADFLKANGNGRKLCDGHPDCADGSDEYDNCEYCKHGQYICAGSRSCINRTRLCDSKRDCPNGDDENDCVKIGHPSENTDYLEEFKSTYRKNGQLMVRKKGVWGKLCVETFSSVVSHWEVKDLARAVCKALTFTDFETVERIEDKSVNSSDPYYELFYGVSNNDTQEGDLEESSSESTPRVGLGFKTTECKSKLVVNVTCQDLQCGTAPKSFTQTARYRVTRIVGGANSMPGKWPWQAALYKNGEYQCGATLISSRWLLSAGHCFYNAQDDYWVARLGTLRRGATVLSPYEQVVRITHVFLHPQYQNVGFVNDVSLLRLEKEVDFTDYVRPVCLPSRENTIRDGRMCTVVGWGQLFEVGRVFPDTLQEVQLPLISTAECRKRTLFLPLYKLTSQMFCAGFDRGGRDACLGDSGGPMMCQETDGRWSLYGVTSNGYGCARANRPGVYTNVASYLDWIEEKMSLDKSFVFREKSKHCSGHRCLLGECLNRNQVCNGVTDCIEDNGSDERNCSSSTHLGLIT